MELASCKDVNDGEYLGNNKRNVWTNRKKSLSLTLSDFLSKFYLQYSEIFPFSFYTSFCTKLFKIAIRGITDK